MTERQRGPWRSLLFVPADKPEFIEKAADRGADALILDLEDGVTPANKDQARTLAARAVGSLTERGADVMVRINDGRSLAETDLQSIAGPGLAGVVVPKAESTEYLEWLVHHLRELAAQKQLALGSIPVIAQIESLQGLQAMEDIAAVDGVEGLALGTEDLCADAGMTPLPHTLHGPAQALVFAARRHGCTPYGFADSIAVYADEERITDAIVRARELGFRGAMAIHPKQVAIMNAHFLPTAEEVAFAERVVAALDDPDTADTGAIAVDGRMVDRPVVLRAREVLDSARRFGQS